MVHKLKNFIIWFLLSHIQFIDVITANPPDPNSFRTTKEIIESFGFEAEEFTVKTQDRRSITIFRILRHVDGSDEESAVGRPVVMLQHGFLQSSSDYVYAGKKSGLGFHLFKKGYDVWLTNARGNIYGTGGETSNAEFWDHSFHETGMYDLPAFIDFILEYTEMSRLFYVGFSSGVTAAFIMLSERPEYNDRIERLVCMAPVSYMHYAKGSIGAQVFGVMSEYIGKMRSFLDFSEYSKKPLPIVNKPRCFGFLTRKFCDVILDSLTPHKTSRLYTEERRSAFWRVFPAGASWKTTAHLLQIRRRGIFSPFSHNNRSLNVFLYHNPEPAPYQISNVRVPTLLLLGRKDIFSTPENIAILKDNLIGVSKLDVRFVRHTDFDYFDFFQAKNVSRLVFKTISNYLEDGSVPEETPPEEDEGWAEEQAEIARKKVFILLRKPKPVRPLEKEDETEDDEEENKKEGGKNKNNDDDAGDPPPPGAEETEK